jgi:acetyl-CoA carboxylase carboxyltransferase component
VTLETTQRAIVTDVAVLTTRVDPRSDEARANPAAMRALAAFLELSPLAANGMYDDDEPGAGIVTGIGPVSGQKSGSAQYATCPPPTAAPGCRGMKLVA